MVRLLVSLANKSWVSEKTKFYVLDASYVEGIKAIHGSNKWLQIDIAQPLITNRATLDEAHAYVHEKLYFYYELIRDRLNLANKVRFNDSFWKPLLLLPLLRHVCACHQVFRKLKNISNLSAYEIIVLSESDYKTPFSFDEHYQYIHSDWCQEQLFSQYINIFHPRISRSEFFSNGFDSSGFHTDARPKKSNGLLSHVISNFRRIRNINPTSLGRRFFSLRSPVVGVLNSYFSMSAFDRITLGSYGRCQKLMFDEYKTSDTKADFGWRATVFECGEAFDDFDKYCFACLKHLMPTSLLEDFRAKFDHYSRIVSQWRSLKYVVSEAWISSEETSFAISVLRLKGVKLITNEHNYLSQQYLGANNKYIIDVTDVFCNLGWDPNGNSKVLRSGSLFDWEIPPVKNGAGVDFKLLIISGLPQVRLTEYSASYSDCGSYAAQIYLESTKVFLETIRGNLGDTYFRAYPQSVAVNWPSWDQKYYLRVYLPLLKKYDDNEVESAKSLMAKASLVVFNYIGTSLWEALINGIPCIFILNESTHHIEESFADMFDEMRKVGICQTSPTKAGIFVNNIIGKVSSWWEQEDVQNARRLFLGRHFGPPDTLIDYLVSLH